jgi:hypothetical protein
MILICLLFVIISAFVFCPIDQETTGEAKLSRSDDNIEIENPFYRLTYRLDTGRYDIEWTGGASVREAGCSAVLSDGAVLKSEKASERLCGEEDIRLVVDQFGHGIEMTVRHKTPGAPELHQYLKVYEDCPFYFTRIAVVSDAEIASNHMVALSVDSDAAQGAGVYLGHGNIPAALYVPYDNDMFVRYSSGAEKESYEVTVVYDNESRQGVVIGSVTHDLWKTRIDMSSYSRRRLGTLSVFAGASDKATHDVEPHGSVTGTTLSSPIIVVGCFDDWRDGLEAYGKANAVYQPALPWFGGVPFGWNSWYAYLEKVNFEQYVAVSDYFKDRLQPLGFHNDQVVYINFDSFWDNMNDEKLEEAVRHVHANGQKAGTYLSPFTYWGKDMDAVVPGTNGRYKFGEIVLRDHKGKIVPDLDGGHPLDITHPGALEQMDYFIGRFIKCGFDFVKLDFLNAGSLEGAFYDKNVPTGTAAYHVGMKRIVDALDPVKVGRPFFISLSIAPLFPSGYGHARRTCCDAQGNLKESEYVANSLTYSWWTDKTIYAYNDPDMIPVSENPAEARTRVGTIVIAGTVFLNGDDLLDPIKQARAEKFLTNDKVNELARTGGAFRPAEGNFGSAAADVFLRPDNDGGMYLALFNWDAKNAVHKIVEFDRIGLDPDIAYDVEDLWTGDLSRVQGQLDANLPGADSTLLHLTRI